MRSEQELREFFRSELRPHVEAWQHLPRLRPPGIVDAVVVMLAAGALVWLRESEPLWLLAGYALLRVLRDVSRVRNAFKQEVLRRVFEFALPGVRYDPAGRVARDEVQKSGLFPESWNAHAGEDLVVGRLGATAFSFSELHLARKRKQKSHVVFHGLFFIADFHKSFRGRTFLLPDVAERTFGTLGRVAQALPRFDGTQLIELEDPDFEKRFVCYATDPLEARYLLSPGLIQRILRIAERTTGSLRIAFLDECLYLALPMGDLFQAPFLGGSVDEDALLAHVRELHSVAGIVEELDLNTRIWSKGAARG